MDIQKEAYRLASNAGHTLSKDYIANENVKTVAGFILKCFGHHEIKPSSNTLKKAMDITNHKNAGYTYEEVELAEACLNYKKYKHVIITAS